MKVLQPFKLRDVHKQVLWQRGESVVIQRSAHICTTTSIQRGQVCWICICTHIHILLYIYSVSEHKKVLWQRGESVVIQRSAHICTATSIERGQVCCICICTYIHITLYVYIVSMNLWQRSESVVIQRSAHICVYTSCEMAVQGLYA
jgi:hypothetical protein